jgi:peptidoglycan/LPS O-acetylase OafA/YrhL
MLVLYHAGGDSTPEPAQHVSQALAVVRMPLFTIISGYVYALRPLRGPVRPFLAGKLRRLAGPAVVAITATIALASYAPSDKELPDPPWLAYVISFDHFWFVQGLLAVFVVIALLERVGALDRVHGWAAALAVALAVGVLAPGSDVMSLWGTFYLAPFFLVGIGIHRFPRLLAHRAMVAGPAALAVCGLVVAGFETLEHIEVPLERRTPLSFLFGTAWGITLFRLRRTVAPLAAVGGFSLIVYLYHQLGISAGERAALALSLPGEAALLAQLGVGMTVPILLEMSVRRVPMADLLVLGRYSGPGPWSALHRAAHADAPQDVALEQSEQGHRDDGGYEESSQEHVERESPAHGRQPHREGLDRGVGQYHQGPEEVLPGQYDGEDRHHPQDRLRQR